MKAGVLKDFAQALELNDVAMPEPGPEEVIVEVEACGVCHSDLHIIDADLPGFKAGTSLPLIPGHEVVGRVVCCGPDVTEPVMGARVGGGLDAFRLWSLRPVRRGA